MNGSLLNFLFTLLFVPLFSSPGMAANSDLAAKRSSYAYHIINHYPEQLGDPQKKTRKNFDQFGYNLSYFSFPLFPITLFINPNDFGNHSYGRPHRKENNGSLYTCKGGFMDFDHLRTAADWTVYLTFKILVDYNDFDLPPAEGSLQLHFKNLEELTLEDIAAMAQKIAFERLLWHEVASWYHYRPNFIISEKQSSFTPEDIYSNFLGTVAGKNIALRILKGFENQSYSQIATEEIAKAIAALEPLTTIKGSKRAYDIVDRRKQLKLPAEQRNKDIWWNSQVIFRDERYIFKRYMKIGPELAPWLVPESEQAGCSSNTEATVQMVPQKTKAGASLNEYYDFRITPDSMLFYSKRNQKQLYLPFEAFSTKHYDKIVGQVRNEMEKRLLPGFDKRNSVDPTPNYKKTRRVIFR